MERIARNIAAAVLIAVVNVTWTTISLPYLTPYGVIW